MTPTTTIFDHIKQVAHKIPDVKKVVKVFKHLNEYKNNRKIHRTF